VAASLLNTGRQVGGSIGLAVLGTVAWTVVANSAHHAAAAVTAKTASSLPTGAAARAALALRAAAYQHSLAAGFDRAFLVAAGLALVMLLVPIAVIRIRRADLNAG
jgi:hypothetical protein